MLIDQKDFDLHIEAGLTYFGKNEDNEYEFVGTDKQWQLYKQLSDGYDQR